MTEAPGPPAEDMKCQTRHRDSRRSFFKAFGATAAVTGVAALATAASAQAAVTDEDILNFALNLEYLEANFYYFAVKGRSLALNRVGGTGEPGPALGGHQVPFQDPAVLALALETIENEHAHVQYLRSQLGASAVAQPLIDLRTYPDAAFSNFARMAGLIGPGQSFDPYADDESFLQAAFLFEEIGVSAYKGAAALIKNKTYLEASAGILATEAYQASSIRTMLYHKGIAMPSIIDTNEAISNARDRLDGPQDDDQSIKPVGGASNIIPVDRNGLIYGRSAREVLNVVYLSSDAVTFGGFFPRGVNGPIHKSSATETTR